MEFTKRSCEEFVEVLASKEPVPGGGGAAALCGAIGMALGNMVGSLTVGKKKYAEVEHDVIALKTRADVLQKDFLTLVERDAEVFEPLSRAYGIAKEDPLREKIMEGALRTACSAPFEIMERCCEAIELMRDFAAKGSALAISDAGCGAAICGAALRAASLNVFINTKSMTDREYADDVNEKAKAMLTKYTALADGIYAQVAARF